MARCKSGTGQRSEVSKALRVGVSTRAHSLVVDWYDWGVGEKVGAAATAGRGIGCLNAGGLVAVLLQGATESESSVHLPYRFLFCVLSLHFGQI